MQVNDLQDYKGKLKRKIEDYKEVVECYKVDKENLSHNEYWSSGYYTGILSTLENVLDDIDKITPKKVACLVFRCKHNKDGCCSKETLDIDSFTFHEMNEPESTWATECVSFDEKRK